MTGSYLYGNQPTGFIKYEEFCAFLIIVLRYALRTFQLSILICLVVSTPAYLLRFHKSITYCLYNLSVVKNSVFHIEAPLQYVAEQCVYALVDLYGLNMYHPVYNNTLYVANSKTAQKIYWTDLNKATMSKLGTLASRADIIW